MKIIITEEQFEDLKNQDKMSKMVENLWKQGFSMDEIPDYVPLSFWQVVTIIKDYDMEIDCKMVEDIIRKLFNKTSVFTKEVITDEFKLYLSYGSFEGSIEYEYIDKDCVMNGYATPYWNGECSLPIENFNYFDKENEIDHDDDTFRRVKIPERFNSMYELIKWFNDEYIKYLIQTIKEFKKEINL